jgi:predicted amidohydrolase YtcJ
MKEVRTIIKSFMLGSVLSVLLVSSAPPHLSGAEFAELVVSHAHVVTVDARQPGAEAFAVRGGRFMAVGSEREVAALVGPATKVMDFAGNTIVPGFIDAHLHPHPIYAEDSPWAMVPCGPARVRNIEELIAALKRKADKTRAGQWVLGSGYQETKLGRQPTRLDLDRASTNHPLLIRHVSGHQAVCNSLALKLAGVTRDTADPAGGRFGRAADGEPTGLLQEQAAGIVRSAGPRQPQPPQAETMAAYRECFRQYLSRGLTSVGVAGGSPALARQLGNARGEDLPLRFYMMLGPSFLDAAVQRKESTRPEDGVRFGAIKVFHGASLSAQTCWLSQPYEGRPGYFGVPPARSQAALDKLILSIHEAGLQAAVHANGDREIAMVVTAFERALARHPRADHRHRIEHGSVVTSALLDRIRKAGLVMVPHSYIWEHGDKMEAYGQARWDWMHAARSMLDLGIPVAGHSDSPVSAADPLLRIQDMVTRTSAEGKVYGAKQRVTAAEALRAWTLGGAYAAFAEKDQGSIAAGKLADFVVLSADPTREKPERIKDIRVEATFIGGKRVWAASQAQAAEPVNRPPETPALALPEPLVCSDGTRVTTAESWKTKRRPELLRLFETNML